jgi:formamidopyrimidine-DNA glycosylase
MPELPEVETIIRYLKKQRAPKILGARFVDVWTDSPKIIKRPKSFKEFKERIKGKKIEKIWRRGKNIIFNLSRNEALLVHQKLTGHLLFERWKMEAGEWKPEKKGFLEEKVNSYIRLLFILSNKAMLALSDLRKFAKVELLEEEELKSELNVLGPEPLDKSFDFKKFKQVILTKNRGKIKQVLTDQSVIAGIGNIYSDEILFESKICPWRDVSKLSEKDLKNIYLSLKKILTLAVKLQGESFSDYRLPSGEKGRFDKMIRVYRRQGKPCPRCGVLIKKVKIGGRSAHYCPKCQKI